MVLQPYDRSFGPGRDFVKPEFKAKWADVGRHAEKLLPCLEPRGGGPPQGGYTPFARKSSSFRIFCTPERQADKYSVTQSYPAGIYIYTTTSQFNTVDMARYMAAGTIITSPIGQYRPVTYSSNDSSLGANSSSFEIYNSTSMAESTVYLDVDDDNEGTS